jgi:hypothetical protein
MLASGRTYNFLPEKIGRNVERAAIDRRRDDGYFGRETSSIIFPSSSSGMAAVAF